MASATARKARTAPSRLMLFSPQKLLFRNDGRERAAVFHVYRLDEMDLPPARYTVEAGKSPSVPLPGAGRVGSLALQSGLVPVVGYVAHEIRQGGHGAKDGPARLLRRHRLVQRPFHTEKPSVPLGKPDAEG